MTIVVGGEALIDLVPGADGTLRAHAGGGPYNTARTLGRLGQPVHYLGCLSDDRFGAGLRAHLGEDGVALASVVDTALPTTLALAEVDARGGARYRFYADGTSAPALTPEAALAALPDDVEMLHVGTLGLVLEPLASALERVVEAVAGRAFVMVDPNCRPSLIADRDAYRDALAATLRHADVVKVSDEDLAYLEPDAAPETAARRLLAAGPSAVLVTRGAEGATIVSADGTTDVAAPRVDVVDTIGAGDAFGGAFLAYVRRHGADLRAATTFACVVAARTCERAGADPPRWVDY